MQPVPATGLTILFEPDEPSVDIVFVHGFTGHPERTWTRPGTNNSNTTAGPSLEPPSKLRRLNPLSASHHLVPGTVPCARVLTYGYDAHIRLQWAGPRVNTNTVYDIAWNLLVALESERRAEPSRPVLFVVHSLGGIVVKEALRRSRSCQMGQAYLRGIFESTIGIIFFGTPHAGADPRTFLHHVAEKVAKVAGFSVNEQIVSALLPSSERLRELRDEFGPMAQDRGWIIYSFQEQLGVDILFGKVVDDTSSYLNISAVETTEHIGRNHMEMCRFPGVDDAEYKKVAAALCRITATVTVSKHKPRTVGQQLLDEEKKRELMNSLRFDQIDARHRSIKRAHAKTCEWLLGKSEYQDWLDPIKLGEHHGFLWIKGKPGTGKSTLMKFALANARQKVDTKGNIILSFFFNARGDKLEKSTVGMYRSLLLQLLERLPSLQGVFDSLGLTARNAGGRQWSVESLKSLFEQAVQSLGEESSLVCYIDALDECDEAQIRDMISFFEHLGGLLSASAAGMQFRGHSQDIVRYLNSQLRIGHSKLAGQIRAEVQDKAVGVFMWVVLVVEILNKEHDRGRIHALQRKLHAIPEDLHELFRDILTRDILTRDCINRHELLLCVQWVLFARHPLRPEQLYFAILAGVEPNSLSEWDPDEITTTVMGRFILDSSKGLAEVTKSKRPTVQFIHESVRDFLLKENGLKEIWLDLGNDHPEGESHERLKKCCVKHLDDVDILASLSAIPDSLPTASSPEAAELRRSATKKFPFLEYATQNILHHADAAEAGGISQTGWFPSFPLARWVQFHNLFERHQARRYTKPRLLYVLAEHNTAAFIRVYPSNQACFAMEEERYGTPILAALATASKEAAVAFVEVHSRLEPENTLLHDLRERLVENRHKCLKLGRTFTFSRTRGVHSFVQEQDDEGFATLLVSAGQVNGKGQDGQSLLAWAVGRGYEATVRLLLDKGAEIETKNASGRTPLSWAAVAGDEAIIRLLLDNGAEIETKDASDRTPLSWAAAKWHAAIVQLLLNNGAEIETRDMFSQTPLSWAANEGYTAVVRLLLDKGADIKTTDNQNRTPLEWALKNRHTAIVKVLLEKRADIEMKDNEGRTPLS
ncbi:hypothetical protein C8A05DRAFT_47392 [Staphylotrichum tortipilum]|uniref:Nephrocystin 3-like N-terminal domain-containing protein n=1 Tax=Staphylotrichum tortipilum TaxID=2831512 RepID=A0AAN6RP40_9PEZI|nr:hypothetical protein C8A05DRAFT_47392 [Staphylotrichum longicolle]